MVKNAKSAAYEAAKAKSDEKVVGRFSRRNVRLQNGVFISKMDMVAEQGDNAMANLRKKFGKRKIA